MYKCSCGHTTDKEWCPKCGKRNTTKWRDSRSNQSSDDYTSWAVMNSVTESLSRSGCDYSSSSYDSSSSSDSGSCGSD